MSTHDYVLANQVGSDARTDLNLLFQAIVSQNSSATEPATMYAYMFWNDTSLTPPQIKQRNAANSAWEGVSVAPATAATHAVPLAQTVGKNLIINGNFYIAQRSGLGVPVALTTTATYATADRWAVVQEGTANGASAAYFRASLAPPTGFDTQLRIGRNASAVTTGNIFAYHVFESSSTAALRGTTATLSFYAKAAVNYSATSSLMKVTVFTGAGTDQSLASLVASTWTTQATLSDTTQVITGGWVRYSVTVSIAVGVNQIALRLGYTPVGTAGADDALQLAGVQLEVSPVATTFEQEHYSVTLAKCQRYCQTLLESSLDRLSGIATSTTVSKYIVKLPVILRTSSPSLSANAGSVSVFNFETALSGVTTTPYVTIGAGGGGAYSVQLDVATTAGSPTLTIGQGTSLYLNSAVPLLLFSEL